MNFYKDKIIFKSNSEYFDECQHILLKTFPVIDLDICNYKSIKKLLKKVRPKIIIHAAAISRPMSTHEKHPQKSILANIIGTSNLTIACMEMGIKLIYFSKSLRFALFNKSNKENDPVLPINNYALSKMGGECAVQMYRNSLILRIFMSEWPFVHKGAYTDVKTNFLYHKEVVKLIPKLINSKGISIYFKSQSVYSFAKKYKLGSKKTTCQKKFKKKIP